MACRILGSICVCVAFIACSGGAMTSQVRTRAARDFSCGEEHTRIVDSESGVYLIQGCGLQASYRCSESASLSTECQRVFLSKLQDAPEHKSSPSSNLAKSR